MSRAWQRAVADIEIIKRWSPVWIVPIVTALIGAWILITNFSDQGPEVVLITRNAEGIEAGKTRIKSRNVDVGIIEKVTLSEDLNKVVITARLHADMDMLLRRDSVFWVVKPQIGREGIRGLDTLFSGAFIELRPGNEKEEETEYTLLESPPVTPPDARGIRVILTSEQAGQLSYGDPVLFRGYRVGLVETSAFDASARLMRHQLFIGAPYDVLVTSNVRFWKNSGIAFDLSAQGMRMEIASLTTLLSGGVSFDVPTGWDRGSPAEEKAEYNLFDDQRSIQDSLYVDTINYLLFFSESVRGLNPGAPVEFRGIRIGTVSEVPFYSKEMSGVVNNDYRIPVLVRIEPGRLTKKAGPNFNFQQSLEQGEKRGLRASLKLANLLTGSLFIDLDFYPRASAWKGEQKVAGYFVLPTVSDGFSQIQQKLVQLLDKLNELPMERAVSEVTKTLQTSRKMLASLNELTADPAVKGLPEELRQALLQLNLSMQALQPGSPLYNTMLGDMQQLNRVLSELQPLLRTLNEKSNALIFKAEEHQDPLPGKGQSQ